MQKKARKMLDEVLAHPVVVRLGEIFAAAGEDIYLVGGSVRDAVMGKWHEDLDFATTAEPDATVKLVHRWADSLWLVGVDFGTVALAKGGARVEITTLRHESYTAGSRHPEVTFSDSVSADLARRDFTVNAIAVSVPGGEVMDPFGGLDSIREGILATPRSARESFTDDPLRMVRAARFVSTLGFRVTPAVEKAMREHRGLLSSISRERIRDELTKLLTADRPSPGLGLAIDTGLMEEFLPEVAALGEAADPEYKHKDILEHTMTVVDAVRPDLILRLAALLHDIAKPETRRLEDGEVTFYGHDVVGARAARKRLRELRFPKEVVDRVSHLIRLHMRAYTYRLGWSDHGVRKYIRDAGPELPMLNALIRADCTSRSAQKVERAWTLIADLERRIDELEAMEETAKIRPPLDGHDVMAILDVEPGPVVGEALGVLLEARLAGTIASKEEGFELLSEWAREKGLSLRLSREEFFQDA